MTAVRHEASRKRLLGSSEPPVYTARRSNAGLALRVESLLSSVRSPRQVQNLGDGLLLSEKLGYLIYRGPDLIALPVLLSVPCTASTTVRLEPGVFHTKYSYSSSSVGVCSGVSYARSLNREGASSMTSTSLSALRPQLYYP